MARTLKLVHDLLDTLLCDRNQRPVGCVDGILLELRPGQPPRVLAMEAGAATLARRLHPRLERWLRGIARRWLHTRLRAARFPLELVRDIGVDVELDVD